MNQQTLRFIIVDDEPIAHRILLDYASKLPHLACVGQCHNPQQALALLQQQQVDFMFLDLHMPEMKGFDFLQALVAPPQVIVTTAYEQYALQGFELNVVDYLLKPITQARFFQAVQKLASPGQSPVPAIKSQADGPLTSVASDPEKVMIKGDKTYHYLPVVQIAYVEAFGNYCLVHTARQTLLTPQKISMLAKAWRKLGFLRIHKSFLVPKRYIDTIAGKTLTVRGKELPIGAAFKREVYRELGLT